MNGKEGYGYEWDAMLLGGPADGCLDRAITINGNNPPQNLIRIVDGRSMNRESLGEKLIERLTRGQVEGFQRVAVYGLKSVGEDHKCSYDYLGTMSMDEYRSKYGVVAEGD
jgi:hypothetical protein